MNNWGTYEVIISDYFIRKSKKLIKKNRFLRGEIKKALYYFNKFTSSSIGAGFWKIRLPGINIGKSSGYRMYIYVYELDHAITPIFIYSKSDMDNISHKELNHHAKKVMAELNCID